MLVRIISVKNSKVKVIDLNEKQLIRFMTAGSVFAITGNPTPVLAAVAGPVAGAAVPAIATGVDIAEKVGRAAQPIKDLLIGIADPVCYIVFTWGLLEGMLGKASSGITRMKYAALGYAGMNWLPVLMDIIRNAKP